VCFWRRAICCNRQLMRQQKCSGRCMALRHSIAAQSDWTNSKACLCCQVTLTGCRIAPRATPWIPPIAMPATWVPVHGQSSTEDKTANVSSRHLVSAGTWFIKDATVLYQGLTMTIVVPDTAAKGGSAIANAPCKVLVAGAHSLHTKCTQELHQGSQSTCSCKHGHLETGDHEQEFSWLFKHQETVQCLTPSCYKCA
jgi:hypothetical protein